MYGVQSPDNEGVKLCKDDELVAGMKLLHSRKRRWVGRMTNTGRQHDEKRMTSDTYNLDVPGNLSSRSQFLGSQYQYSCRLRA